MFKKYVTINHRTAQLKLKSNIAKKSNKVTVYNKVYTVTTNDSKTAQFYCTIISKYFYYQMYTINLFGAVQYYIDFVVNLFDNSDIENLKIIQSEVSYYG